ncbi:MAG: FKBP-type peptidyl-prolyl cis-trans isomerase [Clostridia bacterium]|nr:FKBP-type peptidyl-prolyl cis-trans isomerase [Clostridia bacterium]
MKKTTAFLMAALLACSLLLTSCGGFNYAKEDLSKYVELGTYKGLAFELAEPKAIDDEAIADYIATAFDEYSTLVEQDENYAAKDGDTVNIDFVGKINGEEFDGGSATSQSLELGSDSYIDGFEDGLVGAKKGEKKTLNLKFPTDYGSEELNGKDVVFEVTVNSVSINKYEYATALAENEFLAAGNEAVITYTLTCGDFEDSGLNYTVTVSDDDDKDLPKVCTEALVGLKVGEKDKAIKVTLPSDFEDESAAGKEATFTVAVISASRTTVTDEVDDIMVADTTDYASVAEYTEKVATPALTEQYAKEAKTANISGLWKKVLDGATVKKYPASEVKDVADGLFNYTAAQLGNQYGWAMRDYAKLLGYKNAKEYKEAEFIPSAEIIVKEKLVFNAIVKAENITLTDADKAEGLKTYYEDLGISSTYKTFEEFEAAIDKGEILVDSLYESLLWEKVMDTLLASVAK